MKTPAHKRPFRTKWIFKEGYEHARVVTPRRTSARIVAPEIDLKSMPKGLSFEVMDRIIKNRR